MKIKSILLSITVLLPLNLIPPSVEAADIESSQTDTTEVITCKPYTIKEINAIKANNKPGLVAGAGIVELVINPNSTVGRELLVFGSQMESPKRVATTALIINQLNNDLSLKPFRDIISQLLHDDKENAFSYYANAVLLMEDGKGQESIAQIIKGNSKSSNGYAKLRFHSIVEAGEKAGCNKIQIQRHALWKSFNTGLIIKSRKICEKLTGSNAPEANKACLAMGQNLEKSSITIVDKLNSLAIQRIALKSSPDNATALNEIENRRKKAINCDGKELTWVEESDVTEEADLKFDEIYLESGECSALEFLTGYAKQINKKN
jgi:hypothetical protein